jgi:oligopeptide/dipeptide ABC transporter ATP-binding protein
MRVGEQIAEALIEHRAMSREQALRHAIELLDHVGIDDPRRNANAYPHQFSGGMRQRVMIAAALACRPGLLIADEPTTALDATLEIQIIHRLQKLQSDFGCAILFISHHLGVIAELCEEVVVMYAGEVVENGPMRDVFAHPRHPYTKKLLECDPARIKAVSRHLPVISGHLPDLVDLPAGCVFCERCDVAIAKCHSERPPASPGEHSAACHLVSS